MNQEIRDVSEEIINVEFSINETYTQSFEKFIDIMRKYSIKQGTLSENGKGVISSNSEWVLCYTLFMDRLKSFMDWNFFVMQEHLPQDLIHY